MKKTALILLSMILLSSSAFAAVGKDTKGPFGYNLYDDINRKPETKAVSSKAKAAPKASLNKSSNTASGPQFYSDDTAPEWESEQVYYPNANIIKAIAKYKKGNYSGCLQEMISLTKSDPYNPVVYYYLGMAYTQIGKKDQAVKAYERVMKLNSDLTLTQYATKGRDCLVGGPTCTEENADETAADLDEFINSPYGNGFSNELNQQVKEKQLKNIQKTINEKQNLEDEDIENIQKFDRRSQKKSDDIKIAENTTSNDDIIKAIETLKKAGVNVSINPMMQTNNQYNELGLLLGSNNNNNNAMMNMIPFLLNQNQNGQKIDPQILQSMMMNSMLPDFTFNNDNDKNY